MKKYIPTPETLELIRELFSQNIPACEIAKRIDITSNLMTKICNEYNIVNHRSITKKINNLEIVKAVIELFEQKTPMRKIAEKLDVNVKTIKAIYKDNNLVTKLKGGQKYIPLPEEKICKINKFGGCGVIKPLSEFSLRLTHRKSGNSYVKAYVHRKDCEKIIANKKSKEHYAANVDYYYKRNQNNKEINRISAKKRNEKDPSRKLRHRISSAIGKRLKKENGSKGGKSVMDYLPYTIDELRAHLESLFEPWMNWSNHGSYKLGEERKWHIDHIIPQSKLRYDSMEDPNFQKAWALENLRPLDAIENIKKRDHILCII